MVDCEKQECAICLEDIEKIVIYDCGHFSCRKCFKLYLKSIQNDKLKCHLCRSNIKKVMKADHVINIDDRVVQNPRRTIFLKTLLSFFKYSILLLIFLASLFLVLFLVMR